MPLENTIETPSIPDSTKKDHAERHLGTSSHNEKISIDVISQYLTTEMQIITQRAIQYETMLQNKINFYLVIVTAAIGGLILAAGLAEIRQTMLLLSCLAMLVLSIMGWVTLLQCLDLSANSNMMHRRTGRMRQWFVDHEPSLYPYLPFAPGDDNPKFYIHYARMRSVESTL
jgi:hypothetical protein